jgi:hypothetical protein
VDEMESGHDSNDEEDKGFFSPQKNRFRRSKSSKNPLDEDDLREPKTEMKKPVPLLRM